MLYYLIMKLRIAIGSLVTACLLLLVLAQVNGAGAQELAKNCYVKVTYDVHHKKHEEKICQPVSYPKVTPTPTSPVSFPKVTPTPVVKHDNDSDKHDSDHDSKKDNHHEDDHNHR